MRSPISKLSGYVILAAASAVAIPVTFLHSSASFGQVPNIANGGNDNNGPNGNGGGGGGGPDQANPDIVRRGDPREQSKPQTITGTVQGFNLSPEGMPEGLIVQADGKTVQLNARPDLASQLSTQVSVGDLITASAMKVPTPPQRRGGDDDNRPDDNRSAPPKSDHDVYDLVNLTTAKGQTLGGKDAQKVHVEGNVKQLNYGRRGEVNGLQLDTGDFVRLSREAADQLNLAVGAHVTADGAGHTMANGHTVVAATNVNGATVDAPPSGPQRGEGGPGGGPDGGGRMRMMNDNGGPDAGGGPDMMGPPPPDNNGGGGNGGGQDQPNGPPPGN